MAGGYRDHPNHVPPTGYEREAFEAGRDGRFRTFEAWEAWFYVCSDCGQSTRGVRIHECPARAGPPSGDDRRAG